MKIIDKALNGVLLLEPAVFGDDRGYFFESFSEKKFAEISGNEIRFVQDNQSMSARGVIRGLHLQAPPFDQGKLVRVVQGSVIDVAVDIRKGSPTYGQHYSALLSSKNHLMMWIPSGFAHGFSSLEDNTIFLYKCTNYYSKPSEMAIRFNDPALGIDWKTEAREISPKDMEAPLFADFNSPFTYAG
ncbi:MAG: dTDP-4-dehydrorhamnose 3,5-epimerase [Flavobacteriales bacterium]|nr:dTDP-4-dehydrorhamnose 3,5-epimerase [Flavobacteriales bacterium]